MKCKQPRPEFELGSSGPFLIYDNRNASSAAVYMRKFLSVPRSQLHKKIIFYVLLPQCQRSEFIICCGWRGSLKIWHYAWLLSLVYFSLMQFFVRTQYTLKIFSKSTSPFKIEVIFFSFFFNSCNNVNAKVVLFHGSIRVRVHAGGNIHKFLARYWKIFHYAPQICILNIIFFLGNVENLVAYFNPVKVFN